MTQLTLRKVEDQNHAAAQVCTSHINFCTFCDDSEGERQPCGLVCRPQLTAVDASIEECKTNCGVSASELLNEDSDVLGELTLRH